MTNTQQKSYIPIYKYGLSLITTLLIIIAGCTLPGSGQKRNHIRFSIQNTLPIERKNVPIIMTLAQLRKVSPDFTLKAFTVVTKSAVPGKAPREAMIPAQADDINYDGERDQLVFLLDLEEGETKEISILYDPTVKVTLTLDVNKQTRAGIFPELNAIAALESDLIAYLIKADGAVVAYGKKRNGLFSVDPMFQAELDNNVPFSPEFRLHFETNNLTLTQNPQALNIEIDKPEKRWVIRDFENQENYYIRKSDEQLNVYKSIGLSLNALLDLEDTTMLALTSQDGLIGCGGFALWDKTKQQLIPIPKEGNFVRILANGGMRSIIQRIIPNWNIDGETYQLTSTTYIYGRNPWIEHYLHIDRALPSDYAIVVGIPKLGESFDIDEKENLLWSWGTDPDETNPLGIALIYPAEQTSGLIDVDESLITITLNPNDSGRVNYRSMAIWEGGIDGIETQLEFKQYLQIMTTTMENLPRIKFLPLEER